MHLHTELELIIIKFTECTKHLELDLHMVILHGRQSCPRSGFPHLVYRLDIVEKLALLFDIFARHFVDRASRFLQ